MNIQSHSTLGYYKWFYLMYDNLKQFKIKYNDIR
jgi:hypothetical protein